MCTTKNTGGRRCAAHTRPAYRAAISRIESAPTTRQTIAAQVDGMADIAKHATTKTGAREVKALRYAAKRHNNAVMASYLDGCLNVAEGMRQTWDAVDAETTNASAQHTTRRTRR